MKKIYFGLILLTSFLLLGCSKPITFVNLFYRYENNEYIDINLYGDVSESNCDDIIILTDYWNIMLDHENVNDEKNNIAALNKYKTISMKDDMIELLKKVIEICKEYDTVDPLYGSLKDLWDLHQITKQLPTEEEYMNEILVSKESKITIENNNVSLLGNGILDIDYVKKGYIGEKIKEYLQSKNIDRYVINYNADLVLYGKNEDGKAFESAFYGMKNGTYYLSDITLVRFTADGNCFYTDNGRRWANIPSFVTGIPNDTFETLFLLGQDSLKNAILGYAYYSLEVEDVKTGEDKYDFMFAGYRDRKLVYRSEKLVNLLVEEDE